MVKVPTGRRRFAGHPTLSLHSVWFRDSREGSTIAFCLTCLADGVYPPEGLQRLVERHNERLDLPPEEWSKEVIAEAVHRSGTAA